MVNVGKREWLLAKFTPCSRTQNMVGESMALTEPPASPSKTKITMFRGADGGLLLAGASSYPAVHVVRMTAIQISFLSFHLLDRGGHWECARRSNSFCAGAVHQKLRHFAAVQNGLQGFFIPHVRCLAPPWRNLQCVSEVRLDWLRRPQQFSSQSN